MAIFIRCFQTLFLFSLCVVGMALIRNNVLCDDFDNYPETDQAGLLKKFIEENHINILLPYENDLYEMISPDSETKEHNIDYTEVGNSIDPEPVPEKCDPKPVSKPPQPSNRLRIMTWPLILDNEANILNLLQIDITEQLAKQKLKSDLIILEFDRKIADADHDKLDPIFNKIWNYHHQASTLTPKEGKHYWLIFGSFLIISMNPISWIKHQKVYTHLQCPDVDKKMFTLIPHFAVHTKKGIVPFVLITQKRIDKTEYAVELWEACLNDARRVISEISSSGVFPVVTIARHFYHPLSTGNMEKILNIKHLPPTKKHQKVYDFSPDSNPLAKMMVAKNSYITPDQPVQSQQLFIYKKPNSTTKVKYSYRTLPILSPWLIEHSIKESLLYYSSFFPTYFTISFFK